MGNVGRSLALALITALSSACMPHGPFRVAADLPPEINGRLAPSPPFDANKSRQCQTINAKESCINFVEFDEFGNVFSRQQLNTGVAVAKDVATNGGDVVVYIHGWHHSSRLGDEDVDKFQLLIGRANLNSERKTTGVYVSWRGDSIDKNTPFVGWTSYLLTFWDRKSTAHNVGTGGGVSELLRKLSNIREQNPGSRLVIIGHSFGGAILYSSVSQILAEQIRRDAKGGPGAQATSVADLVVLVNPAFEAMRLKPLFDMARSYDYEPRVRPSLVIITSKADKATRYLFPMGRGLTTLFKHYPSDPYRKLDTTSVGHYESFITHQLVVKECEGPIDQPIPLVALNQPPNKNYCIPAKENIYGIGDVPSMMWTRCERSNDCNKVIGEKYLERGPVEQGYMPYRFPISNIRTDLSIMTGHNDIWNEKMSNFLYELLFAVEWAPDPLPVEISPQPENGY